MKRRLLSQTPFLIASLIFMAGLTIIVLASYEANDRNLVYTLDDPYIHMAIAKNLANHGVFGVTRYEFSSATSSPLWTLLLSATYKVLGVCDWAPGVWAAAFALAALYVTNSLCLFFSLNTFASLITCCAVLYLPP